MAMSGHNAQREPYPAINNDGRPLAPTCPTDAMTKSKKYSQLKIGTAECTGNVHGITHVLNYTCKVLFAKRFTCPLQMPRQQAEIDGNNVVGKKRRFTNTANARSVCCLRDYQNNCLSLPEIVQFYNISGGQRSPMILSPPKDHCHIIL